MAIENFYDDPKAIEALRNEVPADVPEVLLTNPFFDDEPSSEEPAPQPRRETRPEPEEPRPAPEPEREERSPEPPREERQAAPAPQPPPSIDPQTLGQALAYALQQNQPPPAPPKEEDFDPPEVEVDEEAILEGRASLKKALRDAQVTTARALRKQFEEYNRSHIYPALQRAEALGQYLQSRAPLDAETARSAARSEIVRSGLVPEDQVDDVLSRADQVIGQRWDYRVNPKGWEAAARYVLADGNLPVREKTRPPAGAGKGDAQPKGQRSVAKANPYVKIVEQLNGRPLSQESLDTFDSKFGGAR